VRGVWDRNSSATTILIGDHFANQQVAGFDFADAALAISVMLTALNMHSVSGLRSSRRTFAGTLPMPSTPRARKAWVSRSTRCSYSNFPSSHDASSSSVVDPGANSDLCDLLSVEDGLHQLAQLVARVLGSPAVFSPASLITVAKYSGYNDSPFPR
jgi:hypothetical protein